MPRKHIKQITKLQTRQILECRSKHRQVYSNWNHLRQHCIHDMLDKKQYFLTPFVNKLARDKEWARKPWFCSQICCIANGAKPCTPNQNAESDMHTSQFEHTFTINGPQVEFRYQNDVAICGCNGMSTEPPWGSSGGTDMCRSRLVP